VQSPRAGANGGDRERAVGCSALECQRIVLRWNLERGYLHPEWGLRFCPRRSRVFRRLKLSSLVLLELGEQIRVILIGGSQSASGAGRLSYSSGAGRCRTSGLINFTSARDWGSDCDAQRLRTWR